MFKAKSYRKPKKIDEPKLFRKCNQLPIHNFNEAMNGDLNYLKVDPDDVVDELILQQAWLDIMDEFLPMSKNALAMRIIGRKSQILLLQQRLRVLSIINYCYTQGYDVDEKAKEYKTSKEKIMVHIGLVKNDIARITTGIPTESDDAKTGNNNADFERSIAIAMKFGYQIDRFKTVVSTWCAIMNQIDKQNKPRPQR